MSNHVVIPSEVAYALPTSDDLSNPDYPESYTLICANYTNRPQTDLSGVVHNCTRDINGKIRGSMT